MKKQAIVIGLGQFGMSLSRSLTEHGVEVIAVDRKSDLVQEASVFAAQAVALDATDEDAIARLAPSRRDLCICAIGDESREGAIIVTALLRQLGAQRVVSRATDTLLERILGLVGAHDVVNPERAFGERLANRLVNVGIVDEIPLGSDLVVSEIKPSAAMVGRSLTELELPRRFGIMVLGLRTVVDGAAEVTLPDPQRKIEPSDILLVVAKQGATQDLYKKW